MNTNRSHRHAKYPVITPGSLDPAIYCGAKFRVVTFSDIYAPGAPERRYGVEYKPPRPRNGRYRMVRVGDKGLMPYATKEEAQRLCDDLAKEAAFLTPPAPVLSPWIDAHGLESLIRHALRIKNIKPIALVDVDGVMADNEHRMPLICEVVDGAERKLQKPDWQGYMAQAHLDGDTVFAPVVKTLLPRYRVIYLTARVGTPEAVRELTDRLARLGLLHGAAVVMRSPDHRTSTGGYIPATEYKRAFIRHLRDLGCAASLGIDDSVKNMEMFCEEGLVALRLYNHLPAHRYGY